MAISGSPALNLQTGKTKFCQHKFQDRWGWPKAATTYKNKLNAALWPGSVLNMTVIVGGVIVVREIDLQILKPVTDRLVILDDFLPISNETARLICGSTLWGLAVFMSVTFCRRLILRQLLAFRGWMYEPPGMESSTTKVWAVLVKMFSGWRPSLFSYQRCLPCMSVPPLNETLEKLIASLEPLYENHPKKLIQIRAEADQFKQTIGPKLQRTLVLRSFWCDNFVSDWWESYVYLMSRSPLPINSNYYIMDQCYWLPTSRQCARAAGTLYQLLLVRKQLLMEEFEPVLIRGIIPTCMSQYKRIFSTTRIPGEEMDSMVHYSESQSKHVVVSRRGLLYKIDIENDKGQLICPSSLEKQLEWIKKNADDRFGNVPEDERLVAALTSQHRTQWAKARQEFFSQGVNKDTLDCLESAVLFLVLDTESFTDLSARAAHLLHGSVGSFWFDKSIQVIAMSDGHIGLNCEHSYADAPAIAHIFEHSLTFEAITELYDSHGHCIDPNFVESKSKPTPLMWQVDERLQILIDRAFSNAEKNINDLDLVVYDHREFGKGAIKKCKLSPDAFIQIALNTTYRKLTGVPVLTYEASMTRLYKHGRTETVRSLTKEANNFVKAFLEPSKTQEEKRTLLKIACEKHAILYKDAMNGKGIDRHLFALYVASRGLGIDCEFLKTVLSLPWTLSTSQQPQQQISWAPSCANPKYQNLLSPGGGFGPVAEDGYGVSYMVPGDLRIFFHVSSRRSGRGTNSNQFIETLKIVMADMLKLFVEEHKNTNGS